MEGTGKFQKMGAPAAGVTGGPHVGLETAAAGGGAFSRLQVRGKFLFAGDEKFYVRGVTYGPFPPERDGSEYHDPASVERDFPHGRRGIQRGAHLHGPSALTAGPCRASPFAGHGGAPLGTARRLPG